MSDSSPSSTIPPSKLIKFSENSTDRISKLPESVLHHILSFLTTKEAAATSILSKRWRYLWTWVPIIDVNAGELHEEGMSFEQILFKILVLRREWCLRKFSLSCDTQHDYDDLLCSMLCAIVARNIEELELDIKGLVIEVPPSLFSCKTLVVMKLGGAVGFTVSSSVQLPSLKILHLNNVRFKDDDSVCNLISGCPILDDLTVYRLNLKDVVHYEISSPTLRTLVLFAWTRDLGIEPLQSITVNAPNLLYLNISYCSRTSLVLKNMDNLVTAEFDVDHQMHHRERVRWGSVLEDFQGLCNVRSLCLGPYIIRELNQHIFSWDNFPKFKNLVSLELVGVCCSWCLLQHLLHNCPCLENLTLIKASLCKYHSSIEPRRWIPPLDVPNCLSSHLTTLKLQGFKTLKGVEEFIQYIVANSKVLRTILTTCPLGLNALGWGIES